MADLVKTEELYCPDCNNRGKRLHYQTPDGGTSSAAGWDCPVSQAMKRCSHPFETIEVTKTIDETLSGWAR